MTSKTLSFETIVDFMQRKLIDQLQYSSLSLHVRRMRYILTEDLLDSIMANNHELMNLILRKKIEEINGVSTWAEYTRKGYLHTIAKIKNINDENRLMIDYFTAKLERLGSIHALDKYKHNPDVTTIDELLLLVKGMPVNTDKQKEDKFIALIYCQVPLRDNLPGVIFSSGIVDGKNSFFIDKQTGVLKFSLQVSKTIPKHYPPIVYDLSSDTKDLLLDVWRNHLHDDIRGSPDVCVVLFSARKKSDRITNIFRKLGCAGGIGFIRRLHTMKAKEAGSFTEIEDMANKAGHSITTSLQYHLVSDNISPENKS